MFTVYSQAEFTEYEHDFVFCHAAPPPGADKLCAMFPAMDADVVHAVTDANGDDFDKSFRAPLPPSS